MFYLGCHLSSSRGFLAMGQEALSIEANVFQFFTRNPRGGAAKPLNLQDVAAYNSLAAENNFGPILAHDPYTLNAASKDASIRRFAKDTMADDLLRLQHIPNSMYNFHPGSHVQQGVEVGINFVVEMLNQVLSPQQNTLVLLETMSGKGSELGRNFEELRSIIDKTELSDHLGVCLDTCHIWDGGYDIVHNLSQVLDEFDKVIGLHRLRAIHINDSLNDLSAHKDRHAGIGLGHLGLEALTAVINEPRLCHLPFYLETPCDLPGYAREIALLRGLYRHNE